MFSTSSIIGGGNVLTDDPNTYLIAPCSSNITFIIRLCETTQVLHFEFINTELFSGNIKDFSLKCSMNGIDFIPILNGTTTNTFKTQLFDINAIQCRDILIEKINTHKKDRYCTISQVKVKGLSVLNEVIEDSALVTQNNLSMSHLSRNTDTKLLLDAQQKKEQNVLNTYLQFSSQNINNLTSLYDEYQIQIERLSDSLETPFVSLNFLKFKSQQLLVEVFNIKNYLIQASDTLRKWVRDRWSATQLNKKRQHDMEFDYKKVMEKVTLINSSMRGITFQNQIMKSNSKRLTLEMKGLNESFTTFFETTSSKISKYIILYFVIVLTMSVLYLTWLCVLSNKLDEYQIKLNKE
ncbi:hypothetical protein EHI8A_130310 [Entamoeba histolytica HM-1:IMSS-B]|uniref:SUN domain-containing protein n=4 Tax=Entamoeba histolytica TaxID=5759 RepID=C4M1N7_ENTH1|nr:hypothetical protein EHI_062510 [Entamoeba histolytica HM-1:IMSS]EAL45762.2 hypothetical protein EHI_062510 [Entamoeba histolytica HM-1:IMSS]EMH78276.1 hypothetical protein EHI8A_130310 [Entamoeba histolytica HM-1:IMSS-B]ENY63564.1 hypothetical protein EHI7A_126820 [Entamoeba histolytica HM-1:IMSS-A]|eukprot:XP_651149.2 hypothetical protein EHI_062510 [Entamoeba histolytica HM-1:IMSS]